MDDKRKVRVSKFLSKHLRHAPADIGLTLDPSGWVAVDDLLSAADRHGVRITRAELDEIVATSDKQRFALDPAGTRIRANQGHSVDIELGLPPTTPPEILYHGTPDRNLPVILADGLKKMARHHVHLSPDVATALKVGSRYGKPVVLTVAAGKMAVNGFTYFVSANGVWLVEFVPPEYLTAFPPEAPLP